MEALSMLILKAQDGGFISGFKVVGRRGVEVRKSLIYFLLMILLFFVRPLKSKLLVLVAYVVQSYVGFKD